MAVLTWIGIIFCLTQSAIFSGLTLGLFGLSRLRLEVQAKAGNPAAAKILKLRHDANFLLATLLWGNVAVNVLLTLLSDSVLTGIGAFVFSTAGITFLGEIIPQAYFSRNALRIGDAFTPIVKIYQFVLFPVAKPTGFLLDVWLGKEGVYFFQEAEFKIMLEQHAQSPSTDIGKMEAIGASNFLALDDVSVEDEGEVIDAESVIALEIQAGKLIFPKFKADHKDPFLKKIQKSGRKWIVFTDSSNRPALVLNANRFLRDVFYTHQNVDPLGYCHRPILVSDENAKLGPLIRQFKVKADRPGDDVVDHDLILYWGQQKRIITGSDLLGRLLRGIAINLKSADHRE